MVVPFSNGEIVAFRADTGRVIWVDTLAIRRQATDQLSNIMDIRARPFIDKGRVFVISHGGRFGAFDLKSGQRLWARDIAGVEAPLVIGDFLFVTDTHQRVYALDKTDGSQQRIWVKVAAEDEEDKEDPIQWSGPIMAASHLVFTGSNGEIVFLSPVDGEAIQKTALSDPLRMPPVVANMTLYVLNADADLIALK